MEIITSNSFLSPSVNEGLVLKRNEGVIILQQPGRSYVIKSFEIRATMLQEIRDIWYQEYLLSLIEQYKYLFEVLQYHKSTFSRSHK